MTHLLLVSPHERSSAGSALGVPTIHESGMARRRTEVSRPPPSHTTVRTAPYTAVPVTLGGPGLAAVHARLGEVEAALEVLEDLLSAPSRRPPTMLEDHFRLRPIQDDPRFKALMDRERDRVF